MPSKEYYQKNKEKYIARSKKQKEIISEYIRQQKNSPCEDCNVEYPSYVMDFDHRENKKFDVSAGRSCSSLKKIKEEIEKCDLVCSNCHRVRTHG